MMIIVETMSKRNPFISEYVFQLISCMLHRGFLRDSDSKMTGKMIGQKAFLICASAEWGH